jgi:hypothetical protein
MATEAPSPQTPSAPPVAAAPPQSPTPLGALFEAAFRRFGARLFGYLLYAAAALVPAAATALVMRETGVGRSSLVALGIFWGVLAASHFVLCGVLTALVTGTLRSRRAALVGASLLAGVIVGAAFTIVGPLIAIAYPVLVFAPIGAASGDTSVLGAFGRAVTLVRHDLGRSFGALLGLAVCGAFLWFGFYAATATVGGSAQQIGAFAFSMLGLGPLSALVERNLYGDLTGRNVLPPTVSRDQRDRGKRPKRRARR